MTLALNDWHCSKCGKKANTLINDYCRPCHEKRHRDRVFKHRTERNRDHRLFGPIMTAVTGAMLILWFVLQQPLNYAFVFIVVLFIMVSLSPYFAWKEKQRLEADKFLEALK